MPPNTIYVGRPSIYGNPVTCTPHGCRRNPCGCCEPFRCCVDTFEEWLISGLKDEDSTTGNMVISIDAMNGYPRRTALIEGLPALRWLDLACWCPIMSNGVYRPCHADVLLSYANDIPMDEVISENIRMDESQAV